MKNMKYLSLLAILGLLVGCTSDLTTEEVPQPPSVPEQKISHVVPVEQALEDLQGLLEAIDAPAEDGAVTRSGGIRRVKNVTTVSPEALSPGGTRSEATADVEDLLYIVNFENEAGYAILGADDRLEPVYAVVDEGSLTTEEFRYAVTVTPEQAEADGELVFPLQMVAQAAIGGVDTGGGGNGIVGGPITDIEHWWPEGQQPVGIDYEPWETKEQSGILLKTRWNQTKPYNYLCPIENGKNCFAGCVPVAVAQILVFNALNYNKKFYQIGDQLLNEAMWLNIEEAVTHPQLVKPVVSVDTGGGGNGIVGGPITDIEHWWPEGQQPVGIDYEPWETKEQSGILLKTRWNQTKPYNYLCPIENGKNCFAGCVPVAVAQILVFNALNYNKKFYQIGDQLLNEAMWLNIEEAVTHPQLVKPVVSGESMNAQTWAVAYFINKMGEAVGVKYHSDDGGSPAPTKNVVKLLQYLGDIGLGYSNIALSPITTDKVRDMIFVKKLPFYYSGKSSTNSHAWVLDGWLLRERRVITRYAFLPTQYHTESKEFVHANFGWGGQKDGYYTFNAFYTDRGPVSPQSIEDRDYDHDFSAVTYNLSK